MFTAVAWPAKVADQTIGHPFSNDMILAIRDVEVARGVSARAAGSLKTAFSAPGPFRQAVDQTPAGERRHAVLRA